MLFTVCADRGAPGSTTLALALAAARGLPAVVVEADPYGGDLALRLRPGGKHPLPETPTVLGIGAGRSARQPGRRGPIGLPDDQPGARYLDLWREGSHPLTELVRVVPGFLSAEQGASLAWPVLASALEGQTVPVFADLGRIHTGSPSMPLAGSADALITVCRADKGSVIHMVDRLELLVTAIAESNGRPPVVMPVVIAPSKHGDQAAAAVAETLSDTAVAPALRGVGWLAWDPVSVARLEAGGDPWAKPLRKSPLMKSARRVMWRLGMATGLQHAEPGGKTKKTTTTGAPSVPRPWTAEGTTGQVPGAVHPGGQNGWTHPTGPPTPPETGQVEGQASRWQFSPSGEEH